MVDGKVFAHQILSLKNWHQYFKNLSLINAHCI